MRSTGRSVSAWLFLSYAVAQGQVADHQLPTFAGRMLLPENHSAPAGVADVYRGIDVERSIVIRDCGIAKWCESPRLAFEAILKDAAKGQKVSGSLAVASFKQSAARIPAFDVLLKRWQSKAPLGPIAVVNRLDLARWTEDGKWAGAEVRVVYAPDFNHGGEPADLTAIVEFQYPPLDWAELRALAAAWNGLGSKAALTGAKTFSASLQDLLWGLAGIGSRRMNTVRLRTNSDLMRTGTWMFHQWELAASGWQQVPLDDEISMACYASPCEQLTQVWDELEAKPTAERYSLRQFSALLAGTSSKYSLSSPPLGYLANRQAGPRHLLSMQTCTGCHRTETGVKFRHIERDPRNRSVALLSEFLTGQMADAGYDDLMKDPSGKATTYPVSPACYPQPCDAGPLFKRQFHDIGRRRLFLAALLNAAATPNPRDVATIEWYGTRFSH